MKTIKTMFKCLATLFLLCPLMLNAQVSELGSWNLINVKYTHNPRWGAFVELQMRSLKFYDNFYYYEYKGGITYKIHENVSLALAAGSYQTYPGGGDFVLPKSNDEFRIWPQLIVNQSIGFFKSEQRIRIEARYTSKGYRNRFRYRFGLSYPFGNPKNGYKPFQILANNELFFTNRAPYFERNRFQAGFLYKNAKTTAFQIGYLHQFDYTIIKENSHDFLVLAFYYELSR